MFNEVEWMVRADMHILHLLGKPKPLTLTTTPIARNANYTRQHISGRLNVLVEKDLVDVEKQEGQHPIYSITELGQSVIDGKIDPEYLECR